MGRRRLKYSDLKRRQARFKPRALIIAVCEGGNTEPDYLRKFSIEHGNQLVRLVIVPAAGVPTSIIDVAIEEKKKILKDARRNGNSFDKIFEVWGIFDVDAHPNIKQARDKAAANDIKVAISNPCFDLWGVLHFEDHNRPDDRHQVQRRLRQLMPKYDPNGSKLFDYEQMRDNYDEARDRAERGQRKRDEEGTPGGNPSTNIFLLLELIIQNGIKAFE